MVLLTSTLLQPASLSHELCSKFILTADTDKPTALDYLVEFVYDLRDFLTKRIEWKGKTYIVKMIGAVCDAPARATIKHTKQFMARYGCDHYEK